MVKKSVFLVFLYSILSTGLFANTYEIPEILVEVTITPSGVVKIQEHRTYDFDGDFSWADYRLPKRGFSEIKNIQVSDGDTAYINENSEQPGTFNISENNNAIIIKWHYNASDESRVFTVSYELTNALVIGHQWSEFFWNYLASGREKSTRNFYANITFSDTLQPSSLHSWSYGHESSSINHQEGYYQIVADNIPKSQSIRTRLVFPSSVFNQIENLITDDNFHLELVEQEELEREQERARIEARNAFYQSITLEGTILLSLLSLGVFLLIYNKFGKRHAVGTFSDTETIMLPDNTQPALIGMLLYSQHVSPNHLTATIFDLARRGWFNIHEQEKEQTFFSSGKSEFVISKPSNRPQTSLLTWEEMIVDFIDEQLEKENSTFEKISQESSKGIYSWYSRWCKALKKDFNDKKWIDRKSYKGVFINIIVQILFLSSSVFLLIRGDAIAFVALFISVVFLVASIAIIRRTSLGEAIHIRWKAYHNGLKNADKRTINMETLDRHFIYATAFHLSEKQLTTLFKSGGYKNNNVFPWIILMPGSLVTPANMASSMKTLTASGNSSFSGTSGGMGASSGMAGGGASGGAG